MQHLRRLLFKTNVLISVHNSSDGKVLNSQASILRDMGSNPNEGQVQNNFSMFDETYEVYNDGLKSYVITILDSSVVKCKPTNLHFEGARVLIPVGVKAGNLLSGFLWDKVISHG